METITIGLFFLVAVVVSGWLARLTSLALPLVQIGLGCLIATVGGLGVQLNPHMFFLLFLPPLLFLDGWKIPKVGLMQDRMMILELALGLVVFTVLGVGLFIHWLIPAMPYAVAFALAAILSPTDPIAVSAIATRAPIPKRLMHILEGESLLNDASGLVCMRFAVAAALTGVFSFGEALLTFTWLAVGGIASGVFLTLAVTKGKDYITLKLGEEPGSQILVTLLIPFGAYLLAEAMHCSGILAAVAAGVTMSFAEQSGRAMAVTRVRRTAVWDTVQFTLNGIIFVLLGEQLPAIIEGASKIVKETGHHEPIWLIVYVMAINLALAVLRFIWVWVSLRFTMFRATRQGRKPEKIGWRLIAVTSLAGVRGAITLAGILTLPLVMLDGTPFPARDLAIFLAAGVIIVSLVTATVLLPILLKGMKLPPEPSAQRDMDRARVIAAQAAIKAIENAVHKMASGRNDADLYTDAAGHLMDFYRQRITHNSRIGDEADEARKMDEVERQLRLHALKAERDEIYRLGRERKLPDDVVRLLVREIDLMEERFTPVA